MQRIQIALLAALGCSLVASVARAEPKNMIVANIDDDQFALNLTNTMYVHAYGSSGWVKYGFPAPGVQPAYGLAPVKAWYGYKAVFLVGTNGHLYELYLGGGGTWVWADHGTSPDCGALGGNPSAVADGNYVAVMMKCQNGAIAERYYSGGWHWAYHGFPPSSFAAGDPAYVSATGYTGAFVVDAVNNLWELAGAQGSSNWLWYAHGNPGVGLTGNASMVRNPFTNYTGGLFVGNDGNAYERYYFTGGNSWAWAAHGTPGGVCPSVIASQGTGPSGPGFSMATNTTDSGVFGVVKCANSVTLARRYYDPVSGGWHWSASTAPWASLWDQPFAVAYKNWTGHDAYTLAFDGNGISHWVDWGGTTLSSFWNWYTD